MRKLWITVCIVFVTMQIGLAQPWIKYLPQEKKASELNLYDYKKAFDTYWVPFNVDKGYYMKEGVKTKAAGWKQFLRWYHHMESQVNPATGEFPKYSAQQVYDAYKLSHPTKAQANASAWENVGPSTSEGGYAGVGRINCIAFHPTDNNTYWVGAPAGGLWQTTNNGDSWTCLTEQNAILGVTDIVIPSDYADSHTIYIATGDKDATDNRSIGVLKTTDAGATWQATDLVFTLDQNEMVNRLLLDPNDDNTIIAATTDGVYKTTDGGANWSEKLSNRIFIDMEYMPGNFSVLYGCSKGGGSVTVSTDGGANWSTTLSTSGSRVELAVSPDKPDYVYALVSASNSGLYGVYRSQNQGANFSQMVNGGGINLLGWSPYGTDSGGQGWYDLSLAVSPFDANLLFVGGVNTWKSTDGGENWQISSHWSGNSAQAVHADKHILRYRSNGDLFEGNDGGIYILQDGSTNWEDKTNGMIISQMYKLSVSASVADEVITGLQDNGTKLLSNNWYDVKGGDGMECLIDYTDADIQYGTYVYGQISRTTNHWNSSIDIEPSAAGNGAWVTPYIIDPEDPATLYAGYSNVWKTTNRGNNWTKISSINVSDKIRSMAIAPSDNQVLCVAGKSSIWRTNDGGETWNNIKSNLPASSSNITYIAIKTDDPNTIWVSLSSYNDDVVYETTDAGASWHNISQGLPNIPAYSIVQNKMSSGELHLYVGTELGVYFKRADADWIEYNQALPKVKTGELEIYYDMENPDNNRLYLASYGRGLWKSPLEPYNALAPVVFTMEVANVDDVSALLKAKVLQEGADAVTERGFVWDTVQHVDMTANKLIDTQTGLGEYSIRLEQLEPQTTYYYKAYAINSHGTVMGSEKQFTTACGTQSTPIIEGFEAHDFPPACWTQFMGENGLGTVGVWRKSATHYEGSLSAYVPGENVSGGLAEDWLVTPMIQMPENASLTFYQKQTSVTLKGSEYSILVSTTSQEDISTFTEIATWGEDSFTNNFTEKAIDLSAYAGQSICLAFRLTTDAGDGWYIDAIQIKANDDILSANIVATTGCGTGSLTVSSNQTGMQHFTLLTEDETVLQEVDADANAYQFDNMPDGIYKAQVSKASIQSPISDAVELKNIVILNTIGDIEGPDMAVETANYSISEVQGADTYIWSVDDTWQLESGQGTAQINVLFPENAVDGIVSVKAQNTCGDSELKQKSIDVSGIGIPEHIKDKLNIYPNPVTHQLHLNFEPAMLETDAQVRIMNINSKVLIERVLDANTVKADINVQHLPSGVYMLQIQTVDWTADYKVVKK